MKIFVCLLNIILLTFLVNGSALTRGQGGKSVLCYFEGESINRPHEEARFAPEDVDVEICTHLVYNRAVVNDDLEVVPRDKAVDLLEDGGKGPYNRTLKLKEIKPGLVVVIDVYDNTGAATAGNRTAFSRLASNAADFVTRHGFDAMLFRTLDGGGFEEFAPVIHEEFVRQGIGLMTNVLPPEFLEDLEVVITEPLSRNFDLISVGSYWKLPLGRTEILSSLAELERVVESYLSQGVPPEKIVVAIPAFSISVELLDRGVSGVGVPFCDVGSEGDFEEHRTFLHNSEVMRKIANKSEDWVVVRDEASRVSYGHSNSLLWMSFEDPESVREKANFALERNLAGVAIVKVDMEDFKGVQGATFPLTRAAYNALHGST